MAHRDKRNGAPSTPGIPFSLSFRAAAITSERMANAVRDNPERRFELDTGDGIAFANYRRYGGVVTIMHTAVPGHINGRGIGTQLVRGALDLLRAEGAKVVPMCPFVGVFIAKHPEYADLLR
jgi:predicted GNAT family acetyltransferase